MKGNLFLLIGGSVFSTLVVSVKRPKILVAFNYIVEVKMSENQRKTPK